MNVKTPIKTVDTEETVDERLTDNVRDMVLPNRGYLLRDENGETVETPEEMFHRVASNVAKAEETEPKQEKWTEEFEEMMSTLQFIPNTPTLMNAGASLQQLSACFVLEPRDDMKDILEKATDAGLIFKSGGGVGYAFSHLRPKGTIVSSTKGESSGPVSFMHIFNEVCNQVEQGGKRRGAQMGILRVDHPDIARFATAKRREGDFANFNISAGVTDEFIEAVRNDEEYTFYSPQSDYEEEFVTTKTTKQFYNAEYADNPSVPGAGGGELVESNFWRDFSDDIEGVEQFRDSISLEEGEPMRLPARFIWNIFVDGAWRNGEPGLFYLDETNRQHSFDANEHPKHKISATNPCAEQPLSEYEACNLAHINLSLMMEDDAVSFTEYDGDVEDYIHESVDFDRLGEITHKGVRFLDNVVTQSDFPLEEITERVEGQRKIGLGIMGFAQMLYQMGIRYGSDESFTVAQEVMQFIDKESVQASHRLAGDRGTFGYWDESKYAAPQQHREWFESHTYEDADDWPDGFPIRNHNTTTIAPTGTTSMIGNTSGGCEPVYNVANYKNVGEDIRGAEDLVEFDDYFLRTLEENNMDVASIKIIAKNLMEQNEFDGVDDLPLPQEIKDIFVTTQDISSEEHTRMQRAFQQYVDSGISKTINLPNSATRDDVEEAYLLALSQDDIGNPAKGLTVYRDGSREKQVLTTTNETAVEETALNEETIARLHAEDEISVAAMEELGYGEGEAIGCPECEDGEMVVAESCKLCMSCGYSPCS